MRVLWPAVVTWLALAVILIPEESSGQFTIDTNTFLALGGAFAVAGAFKTGYLLARNNRQSRRRGRYHYHGQTYHYHRRRRHTSDGVNPADTQDGQEIIDVLQAVADKLNKSLEEDEKKCILLLTCLQAKEPTDFEPEHDIISTMEILREAGLLPEPLRKAMQHGENGFDCNILYSSCSYTIPQLIEPLNNGIQTK